jgi:hypothetical protein
MKWVLSLWTKHINESMLIEDLSRHQWRQYNAGVGEAGVYPACALLKIGRNMIFWHKIVIFHTKYPKNVCTSPPLGAIVLSAPPPNLKILDPPLQCPIVLHIEINDNMFVSRLFLDNRYHYVNIKRKIYKSLIINVIHFSWKYSRGRKRGRWCRQYTSWQETSQEYSII